MRVTDRPDGKLQAGPAKHCIPTVSWPGAASFGVIKADARRVLLEPERKKWGADGVIQWECCGCRVGSLVCTLAVQTVYLSTLPTSHVEIVCELEICQKSSSFLPVLPCPFLCLLVVIT